MVKEWLTPNPTYGLSLYTPEYYQHIWCRSGGVRAGVLPRHVLGVPFGLLLGWSSTFKEYVFPVFEMLRPIPILAWVPLAIVMFIATESAVIFLAFLASFFATALNTMLGVQSIDESYIARGRTAWAPALAGVPPRRSFRGRCPSSSPGLQISIGVSWFSLVAAEMVSGQYGLGYVINTSYMMVRYPTIVIGMVTLGIVGYATSALVRAGRRLPDAVARARARAAESWPMDDAAQPHAGRSADARARSCIEDVVKVYDPRGRGGAWRSTTAPSRSAPARSA